MKNIFFYLVIIFFLSLKSYSYEKKIIIASTTSTYDTGLLTYINTFFTNKYGINVQVLSQGTGQAIRTAKDGNIEILLVHHKKSEINFIKEGYGIIRHDLMYNDFILVGPKTDVNECIDIETKLNEIIDKKLSFISRGDNSGTHMKEIELWNLFNYNPANFNSFYIEVGQGMGNTLLITNEKYAYTLTDRGTWISFLKKDNLKIICQSLPPLLNQYGIILVNPKLNDQLNISDAKKYINWITSKEGKDLINSFKKEGQQLFYYNFN